MIGPTVKLRGRRGSWDLFVKRYKPIPRVVDDEFMRETDDPEVEEYRKTFPHRLWTVCETDGIWTVITGWHLVNRMGYILTELPFSDIEDTNPGYVY